MGTARNMLSIKYENVHGMKDNRWVTHDKIIQYRGLIKLFERDNKIVQFDKSVRRKRQSEDLNKLKNSIENSRQQLQNCVLGDKQVLRNTLAEHKEIQMAYQDLPSLKVIDHIHQENFSKRKRLDLLHYQMKQTSDVLIKHKLQCSVYEDRLKYNVIEIPTEVYAHTITGKVQDAMLKREAALAVKHSYQTIIHIMKRDAFYYDAVLTDITRDAAMQARCMFRATEIGQLATEYLDDRKQEFHNLAKIVKRDLKDRLQTLELARQRSKEVQSGLRFLLRRDSDINIGKVVLPHRKTDRQLMASIKYAESLLSTMQQMSAVIKFDDIFPCIQEQARQKQRLIEFVEKTQNNRDNMQNKVNHSQLMQSTLYNTMAETTLEYKKEKQRLLALIEEQNKRKSTLRELTLIKNNILADIVISLLQLQSTSKVINVHTKHMVVDAPHRESGYLAYDFEAPEYEEQDGWQIIQDLKPKLMKLVEHAPELKVMATEDAERYYHSFVAKNSKLIHVQEKEADESMFDDFQQEGASAVPTREEVKRISASLVAQHSVDPDMILSNHGKVNKV